MEREERRRSAPIRIQSEDDVTDSVPVRKTIPPPVVKKQLSLPLGKPATPDLSPVTPTPDYDFESFESFKLTDKSAKVPSPPPIYFSGSKSVPATMKRVQRPVSVIVGEYSAKKQPVKFDFIGGDYGKNRHEDMSVRLKNELEMTLSRSNLRRRNDSVVGFFHYFEFSTIMEFFY